MLGEKIGDESGKVTGQRVLSNPGGGPKMETSFKSMGVTLGMPMANTGTYTAVMRPDGTLYGEGQGIAMSPDSDAVTWVGHGIGMLKTGGAVSYRGALYYQTTSAKLARLNGVVGVFEYDVDAEGNTRGQIWEWK
jgi:hypothetical protein